MAFGRGGKTESLQWIQDWTVKYNQSENIALMPVEGGAPEEIGVYGLSSWKAVERAK
jgi:hypothetical protein